MTIFQLKAQIHSERITAEIVKQNEVDKIQEQLNKVLKRFQRYHYVSVNILLCLSQPKAISRHKKL